MNWRFCPHCETQLDEATGICPACRWDPLSEPEPAAPEPVLSLSERYRGTPYDSNAATAQLAAEDARPAGVAPKAKLLLIVGVLALFGLYGGMFAYIQIRDSAPPAPATLSVP
jgi:hypothetical protein